MVPLVSALNETPSSIDPVCPLSTVAGTAVLGQIVCWARVLAALANIKIAPNNAGMTCLDLEICLDAAGTRQRKSSLARNLNENKPLILKDISPRFWSSFSTQT